MLLDDILTQIKAYDTIIIHRHVNPDPDALGSQGGLAASIQAAYPDKRVLKAGGDVGNLDWLSTMDESRILQWEQILHITPLEDSTLQDRREVIIARIFGGFKLNTQSIENIVHTFTNGYAGSWFKDSTIYVIVYPPQGNKQYKFENIEAELMRRKPAHLNMIVDRGYPYWQDIYDYMDDWQDVIDTCETWDDVKMYPPPRQRD